MKCNREATILCVNEHMYVYECLNNFTNQCTCNEINMKLNIIPLTFYNLYTFSFFDVFTLVCLPPPVVHYWNIQLIATSERRVDVQFFIIIKEE